MPAPIGEGVPQRGDRSARNTHAYPDLHASDIEEEEYTYHNPWPMAAGEAAVSDGDKLVPTDIATQAELDAHEATADAHHDPVTLSAEAADVLAIMGQELGLFVQPPNTVLAGPAVGPGYDEPTFRALVAADLGSGSPDGTKFLRDDLTWQFAATDGGGGGSGAPAGYAETIGDGVNTAFTITHDLDTTDVMVQVYDLDAAPYPEPVGCEVEVVDADSVRVTSLSAPATDQYRVLVIAASVMTVSGFTDLADTPGSYSGQGGKYVAVKADGTGLEFL